MNQSRSLTPFIIDSNSTTYVGMYLITTKWIELGLWLKLRTLIPKYFLCEISYNRSFGSFMVLKCYHWIQFISPGYPPNLLLKNYYYYFHHVEFSLFPHIYYYYILSV